MSNCGNCGEHKNTPESVPYIVHEASMARMERQIKRGWIALLVAVSMLFASNAAWLWAWCQYDYSSEEVIVDSDDGGNANYIGNNGDIVNGENNSPKTEANQEEP
jgi:hypothetical protein